MAKTAVSLPELAEALETTATQKSVRKKDQVNKYALSRALRGLIAGGYVESHDSGQNRYARLTKEGKKKAHRIKLEGDTSLLNLHWDGKWRVILLDLPEDRKNERDGLRYLLKKAGFTLLKNSVWMSPYPFEHLFMNIKKDLGLTTEIMIFVTCELDRETEEAFLKLLST